MPVQHTDAMREISNKFQVFHKLMPNCQSHCSGIISQTIQQLTSLYKMKVIVNKLHRKKVVGKWSGCGRYVVGKWSVSGRYVVGKWLVVRLSVGGR